MIRKLEWDSNFFGFNIAHLEPAMLPKISHIDEFIRLNKIECVQACCDISDINTINLLEEDDFRFSDLRATYAVTLDNIQFEKNEYIMAERKDIPTLKDIARSIAVNSRYYDHRFNKKKVEELYEIWLEKSINGHFDNICLKVSDAKFPAGFATIKFIDSENARIGLIGIHVNHQKKGYGKSLLVSIFNFLNEKNIKRIEVVTQGKNIHAQNFYIANGFKIKKVESWYYKFLSKR